MYEVQVNFSRRPKNEPDACSFEIEADTEADAIAEATRRAKIYHPRCNVGVVVAELFEVAQ